MQDLGAEVLFHSADFDAARVHCETLTSREKLCYVHSANEPFLIAGVATIALEILGARPHCARPSLAFRARLPDQSNQALSAQATGHIRSEYLIITGLRLTLSKSLSFPITGEPMP